MFFDVWGPLDQRIIMGPALPFSFTFLPLIIPPPFPLSLIACPFRRTLVLHLSLHSPSNVSTFNTSFSILYFFFTYSVSTSSTPSSPYKFNDEMDCSLIGYFDRLKAIAQNGMHLALIVDTIDKP